MWVQNLFGGQCDLLLYVWMQNVKSIFCNNVTFSTGYAGYGLKGVLTAAVQAPVLYFVVVYNHMNDAVPRYLQELIPEDLPRHHLRSSTQSRFRIPSVEQQKTLWNWDIAQYCIQTVEWSACWSERVLLNRII